MVFNRRAYPPGAALGSWTAADGWPHRVFRWHGLALSTPPVRSEVEGRNYEAGGTPLDFAPDERETLRYGRGSILFLGGRGDIFEKYLEAFDHWHRAGWSVTSFDWRGQGGSGRLSADPRCGHAASFAPWIDDLAQFVTEWQAANPGPHIVIGHSMGGHLTLRALSERRIAPAAAVLVAPMLGLKSAPFGARFAAKVAALMCRIGKPERLAWKANERPGVPMKGRRALLTHDGERYEDELWWKAQNPDIAVGPPSWAWVAEAYRSTLALEAPGRIERIDTPVLMLAAAEDRLVDVDAIRRAAMRLPNVKLRVWGPESAHEILREADPVRLAALAEIDHFLDAHAPAR